VPEPTFADLLNDHLRYQGHSAQWLANRLGVSAGTVSRWLSGDTMPRDQATIVRIADVLGVHYRADRKALFAAAGKAFPETEGSQAAAANDETIDHAGSGLHSFRLQLNSALLSLIDAAPERIAEKLYARLQAYDREVAAQGFQLYPSSCGDKGIDLAHRRLFVTRAFGLYFTGLLERDNIYIPISEQIDSPVIFAQSELPPLARIMRALEHPKGPRVIVIGADGGMGKSTLAAKIVRCLHEQQQIDVILGDSAKTERVHPVSGVIQPLTSGYQDTQSFCAKLMTQLGLPSRLGSEAESYLLPRIRNRLVGRRAVIVLDNLETITQGSELLGLLRLLSSRDVRIIVTTRNVEGLESLAYKTMVVHLRTITTVASCRTFLRWHVRHFQEGYDDLGQLNLDETSDGHIQSLINRTGGIPLLLQIVISTIARTSWTYIDELPTLYGAELLNFLYAERWRELVEAGQAGVVARQILKWVAQQQYDGEGVTFALLDQWAAEHNVRDLPLALRLLNERFLMVNHDFEDGYLTIVPSLTEFLDQVNNFPSQGIQSE
jgi:transcriptional regulator with XRE-family HTH domain